MHNSLTDSDYLFFIRYLPENTLKACWFLVQINHAETALLNMNSKRTDGYHVTFISRYPKDRYLCDNMGRWWLLWHKYQNDKNNVPIYGARMLFGKERKPNPDKYVLWIDSVRLTDFFYYLYGPFLILTHTQMLSQPNNMLR